ncbi:MAG: hypothetical protein JXA93_06365 [Anaerolineae bacterium]|nr:hypothetical protein [Anaerolineae bacterium]
MNTQTDFLAAVDQANPLPGSYWITIGQGHRVFTPGTRFLVVEERGIYLLAWRDGIRPPVEGNGTVIHRRFVSNRREQGHEP